MKRWYCYRVSGKHNTHVDAPDADTAIKLARVIFQRSVKRPGEIRVREVRS